MPRKSKTQKNQKKDYNQLRYQLLFIGIIALPSGIAGALVGPDLFQNFFGIDIVSWQGFLVGLLSGGVSAGVTIARSNLSQRKHSTATPEKSVLGAREICAIARACGSPAQRGRSVHYREPECQRSQQH